jgi:anti-sigma regulatory factor (Ser/Thr protein kinase)
MLAALAEHTWQVEREQQVALTLQQSLLPERLPTLDGWDLFARYLPASDSGEVGGDWYDVLALPDGTAVVSIGDVAGHGLGAAVTMGQLRNAIRAYAVQDPSPDAVLDRLTALLTRLRTPTFATLFIGHLQPASGVLTWCSAGHPPPVHDESGRPTAWLAGPVGPPVGVAGGTPVTNRTVLRPGARLLLYTDGLVEERGRDIDAGLRRVLTRTASATDGDPPLREIVEAVLTVAPQPRRDDVAVLALHRHVPAPKPVTARVADVDECWTYPLEPTAAATMRRDVRAALTGSGIDPDVLDDLLLATSEAVNNAVEHAQRPSRPEVEVQVRISAGTARIAVQDFGSWRSRQPAMDRGRGALLMNAYGDVQVVSTSTGTLVVIERRLGAGPDAGPDAGPGAGVDPG